jgi:hypothetical protein
LHTPTDGYLGALVAQEPAPHQPAVVLALYDQDEAMLALFVRPMIRMNSDYSKVWAVRDASGDQIVDVEQDTHLFRHPREIAHASRGDVQLATMTKHDWKDAELFLDESGAELVQLTTLADISPGNRDQRVHIEHHPGQDPRVPLSCALVRLATRFGQPPAQPAKTGVGTALFGAGPGTAGLFDIVDDVLRAVGP